MGDYNYRFVISRFALMLGSLIVTLFLLEGLVRIFIPQQLISSSVDHWMPTEKFGWRRKPDLDIVVNTGERDVRLLTDHRGFRIGAHNPGESAYKVLALGDSFVAALQVDYEDTFTARLERQLTSKIGENVVFVNAAVGGWNPNQYLLQAKEALANDRYDLLLAFVYVQNDIVEARVDWYPAVQSVAKPELRLPEELSFAEIHSAISLPVRDYLEKHSQLYILYQEKGRFLQMRTGTLPPYFPTSLLKSEADSSRWAITADICADIAQEAKRHDTHILFVLLPAVYQVNEVILNEYIDALGMDPKLVDVDQPSHLLAAEFEARGLRIEDTIQPLREAYALGQTELYGEIDAHFSPGGHQVVAEFLEPIVPDLIAR